MEHAQRRLARRERLPLIELVGVVAIVGALLAIAAPPLLALKDHGNQAAAKADVRAALWAVEGYYADCGTYADATALECSDGVAHTFDFAGLKKYESGLKVLSVKSLAAGTAYCIDVNVGGKNASLTGPGGTINASVCP
jgi:Tfp pilus assembly protein PilE